MLDELFNRIAKHGPDGPPLTPLQEGPGLSAALGCQVLLKCEHLAPTGSFKYRGALSKFASLGAAANAGVVTASTGNHGKAVSTVARERGIAVTVFASASADPVKLEALRSLGARVELVDGSALDAELTARRHAIGAGLEYISPYNDLDVIAGHAAIGREILREAPQTGAIFIAVGGGGLLSGVGAAAKAMKPAIEIVGCWPSNADSLFQALTTGARQPIAETVTLSDSTMGGAEDDSVTISLAREVLDSTVRVSEDEIRDAMRLIHAHTGHRVEGAAAVPLAALKQKADEFAGRTVAVILCGGNITERGFLDAIQQR